MPKSKPKLILRIRSRKDGGLCNVWLLRSSGGKPWKWPAVKAGATVAQCVLWGVMEQEQAETLAQEFAAVAVIEREEWKIDMPEPVKVREAMDVPDALPLFQ